MGTAEAHDERSTVFPNGLEVRDARIPAVCEEQAVLQRRRIRQELSFGLLVGRDLDRTHLVGEATVRGVNLDRCRLDRGEPRREHVAQLILEGERRTVLGHREEQEVRCDGTEPLTLPGPQAELVDVSGGQRARARAQPAS